MAFKLAWQVCKSFGDGKKASPHLRDFLIESIGLVALATVADMVPLEGENRIFVRHGLAGIDDRPSAGLRALLEVSGLPRKKRRLTTGAVGFKLAPRINAAGRLENAPDGRRDADDRRHGATRGRWPGTSTSATGGGRRSSTRSSPRRTR